MTRQGELAEHGASGDAFVGFELGAPQTKPAILEKDAHFLEGSRDDVRHDVSVHQAFLRNQQATGARAIGEAAARRILPDDHTGRSRREDGGDQRRLEPEGGERGVRRGHRLPRQIGHPQLLAAERQGDLDLRAFLDESAAVRLLTQHTSRFEEVVESTLRSTIDSETLIEQEVDRFLLGEPEEIRAPW